MPSGQEYEVFEEEVRVMDLAITDLTAFEPLCGACGWVGRPEATRRLATSALAEHRDSDEHQAILAVRRAARREAGLG